MKMEYLIKSASQDDLKRLKEYKLDSIIQYADLLDEEEMDRIKNYVDTTTPKQINDYKNIICEGKIVGSFLITNNHDTHLIDEIYLESDYRGKGIGTKVIKNIISSIDDNVYLWVYKNNKAVNLYKRLGFKIINTTETRYYMEYKKSLNLSK